MQCVVYVLRRAGKKLPLDVVKSRPHQGWLVLGDDSRKFYPRPAARLFSTHATRIDVITPIVQAHVIKIERGGILIFGQEEADERQAPDPPQAWWCMPGPLDDLTSPQ